MTYKKAARLLKRIFRDRGFVLSRSAENQVGYLALFATEGEMSKHLDAPLRELLKSRDCARTDFPFSDADFLDRAERYADHLRVENAEGGLIDLGWILREMNEGEFWRFFAG